MDYTKAKDYTAMAQQMTDFYKKAVDNGNNALTMIQEHTEKMVRNSLDQAPWFPEEGKKSILAGMAAYKKGYDDFKAAAAEQYRKMESSGNPQKTAAAAGKADKAD